MSKLKVILILTSVLFMGFTTTTYSQKDRKESKKHKKHKSHFSKEYHSKNSKSSSDSGGFVFSINPHLSYWGIGESKGLIENEFGFENEIGYGIEASAGYLFPTSKKENITVALFYGVGTSPKATRSILKDGIYQNAEIGLIISDVFRFSSGVGYNLNDVINSTTVDFRHKKKKKILGVNAGFQFLHNGFKTMDVVVPKIGISAHF